MKKAPFKIYCITSSTSDKKVPASKQSNSAKAGKKKPSSTHSPVKKSKLLDCRSPSKKSVDYLNKSDDEKGDISSPGIR